MGVLNWADIEQWTHKIADDVKASKVEFDGILAITRGGLIPAGLLAQYLGIKIIETVGVASYDGQEQGETVLLKHPNVLGNYLVVDDIADTGKTLELVKRLVPTSFMTAALVVKPEGREQVDFAGIEAAQNTWVTFPWEVNPDAS